MECKYEQALDMWYRLVGELIDTLWNVNRERFTKVNKRGMRINRYIMECKSACIASATSQAIVN